MNNIDKDIEIVKEVQQELEKDIKSGKVKATIWEDFKKELDLDEDIEIWKDIKGYEGKYQVSNLGNVKSLQYKRLGKERILIPYISNRGYYTVALSMNSKKTVRKIHRLVAETFVENIEDLPMVNHIDGNKKNNRAENLEWCTQKHNIRHAWENGLTGVKELRKELETYKKIAEKLAEDLSKHIWLNDKDAIIKIYREEVEEDETHS